jgi:trehalose synthase
MDFLRPYLAPAHGFVFTRRQYVPPWIPPEQAWITPPSIDPFSAKNQQLDAATVQAILATIGALDGEPPQTPGRFTRCDGTTGEVTRAGLVTGDGRPGPADPVVVQVSRWDRLKDMSGVMRGFAEHVMPGGAGYLMLLGPMIEVADDPEGAIVLAECLTQWRDLPAAARARVLLVTLPLDDVEENAAMVNAIQRHAQVIVQKSLAEGFGLTVAEGMWKRRPVSARRSAESRTRSSRAPASCCATRRIWPRSGPRCGSYSTIRARRVRSTFASTSSATATCCNGHSTSARRNWT